MATSSRDPALPGTPGYFCALSPLSPTLPLLPGALCGPSNQKAHDVTQGPLGRALSGGQAGKWKEGTEGSGSAHCPGSRGMPNPAPSPRPVPPPSLAPPRAPPHAQLRPPSRPRCSRAPTWAHWLRRLKGRRVAPP